jgi:uncharacterized protein
MAFGSSRKAGVTNPTKDTPCYVRKPGIQRIGYFGSYARGDWGLAATWTWYPFNERSLDFDTSNFPVPVDLIVYTQEGWQTLSERSPKFHQTLDKGSVWIYESKR